MAEAPLDIRTQPEAIAPAAAPEAAYVTQPVPQPVPPEPLAPRTPPRDHRTMLLWLAAALVGCGAALYVLRRRRTKIALANAASLEAFVPAEPPPAPPAPVPSRTALDPEKPASRTKPGGSGLVSARLRPQLDLQISPLRGIIDERQATIEFSVVAFNKGNAPARDVRIEVAMINASPSQDQEIGRFFDEPAGVGEPIEGIAPMSHVNLTSRVTLPLDQVRALEVAGRRLFVPMLAFNALYRWSGGEGQTSRSYLIGREGDGEKLAPIRLDIGPRIFRNLGARLHHLQVQR